MAKKKASSRSTTAARGVTWPGGFRAAAGTCGIKVSGKPDLTLIVADHLCDAAAVFTRNRMPGAPVIVGRQHIRSGKARAIVCNSGCSNVCTGERGVKDAKAMCHAVAQAIGDDCKQNEVLPASTGVIGQFLPIDKITSGIAAIAPHLADGPATDEAAARAIMTTDLVPKTATRSCKIGGKTVRLAGICKGSGMIAPNMATMLAFLTTDAAIDGTLLRDALRHAAKQSFNRISVDDDTSTSDTVAIMASAEAGNRRITSAGKAFKIFTDALTDLCRDLAYQIVKDGEGATRVYRILVRTAKSERDADRIGRTLAASPLVKTAVHGGDPNWGRLAAAIGRSGAAINPTRLDIAIGGIRVCRSGLAAEQSATVTKKLEKLMTAAEVIYTIDLHLGRAQCEWLSCDLSREYIAINADYTT